MNRDAYYDPCSQATKLPINQIARSVRTFPTGNTIPFLMISRLHGSCHVSNKGDGDIPWCDHDVQDLCEVNKQSSNPDWKVPSPVSFTSDSFCHDIWAQKSYIQFSAYTRLLLTDIWANKPHKSSLHKRYSFCHHIWAHLSAPCAYHLPLINQASHVMTSERTNRKANSFHRTLSWDVFPWPTRLLLLWHLSAQTTKQVSFTDQTWHLSSLYELGSFYHDIWAQRK